MDFKIVLQKGGQLNQFEYRIKCFEFWLCNLSKRPWQREYLRCTSSKGMIFRVQQIYMYFWKRFLGKQQSRHKGKTSPQTFQSEYYKYSVTIPFLEHVIQQMNERFSNDKCKVYYGLYLDPQSVSKKMHRLQSELDSWGTACKTYVQVTLKSCLRPQTKQMSTLL